MAQADLIVVFFSTSTIGTDSAEISKRKQNKHPSWIPSVALSGTFFTAASQR